MNEVLNLTKSLVKISSITPNDKGCQQTLIKRLKALGFSIQRLRFGNVDNFWARRGTAAPLLVFVGHTDVVPIGDESAWDYPPFEAKISDGMLYGRGSADMKSGIAAFVVAVENFIKINVNYNGSIGFLITSDEEGVATDGTIRVVKWLDKQGISIDYCLVGEPSSTNKIGDVIKNGRRGSLNGALTVHGKQGHIAYPQLSTNPIHLVSSVLLQLVRIRWDDGDEHFPPTSMQISNIHAGTGATNMIPSSIKVDFNFRYCPLQTPKKLVSIVEQLLIKNKLKFNLDWQDSGAPFITNGGKLIDACISAVEQITNYKPELSTSGGTSDGRFIAPTGAEVVELGVINKTIHQVNECVAVADLVTLTKIYQRVLSNIL